MTTPAGETVAIVKGSVYINGEKLQEDYVTYGNITHQGSFIKEGTNYTVPFGKYILLGDNRENSEDSREFGFVDETMIKGKPFLIYYPFNEIRFIK